MSTLGLLEEPSREESRLKQIFWPTIKSAQDIDSLATQGFWICLLIAILCLVVVSVSGQPVLAAWTATIFFLGGMGIRQTSVAAAVAIFLVYLFGKVSAVVIARGRGFGILDFFVLAILLANVRGTILASQWKHDPAMQEELALAPSRFNETWRDRLCDQMPPRLWPWARYVFFLLVVTYMGLNAIGVGVLLAHRHSAAEALR
jgi:hypothetical protein